MFLSKHFVLLSLVVIGLACGGGTGDDLSPSGEDLRGAVDTTATGSQVGQMAPDFDATDTQGNQKTLSGALSGNAGLILYFTMWCPVCDTHSTHLRSKIVPDHPNVETYLVDFVSGSVSASRSAQLSNGYSNMETIADFDQVMFFDYDASMGSVVLIDSSGNIRLNESYKDGSRLSEALSEL